ncbi:hypothetical protein CAEBREN_12733 [Caenorhabditis brenneri]|uniref:BTB domain-containing protein n=1 Tax=Caenorhabditis brenneri TaxID=135651 RepID=G0MVX0_CAEBE|nr:hypothetical protein CAEBREN_12733 [Caenorhabditis brenneri]
MTETPELTIYEKTFAKSDKTDAILVVDGKKLHVNKALLSYHSDYFNKLFNSDSKEKSMEEIPIKGVNFENFATVLSLVHGAPIKYTYDQVESLLGIADRFQLPAAKRHIELFILTHQINKKDSKERAFKLADAFKLNDLLSHVLSSYDYSSFFELSKNRAFLDKLTNETTEHVLERMLVLSRENKQMNRNAVQIVKPSVDIYPTAFAKFDKTDAILVVGEKKLHVNKTVLSHHSDYFDVLFNSEFEEKSMEEIPIKGVHFESFVTLLSFYHSNPIIPTKINAEKILELADRFLLPSTKFYMEPYMIQFGFSSIDAIRIGEKYRLGNFYQSGFDRLDISFFENLLFQHCYEELSTDTKRKFFNSYLKLHKEPFYSNTAPIYGYLPNRMTETPDLSIYEKAFVKTDKTDAILKVQGKKLHVNKALLSYHFDYLKTVFNSDSKEYSMEDVPGVKFEDIAIVLSLVHGAPIKYTFEQVESLLEIADRFLLSAAKRHIELFVLTQDVNEKYSKERALYLADKFKLNDLINRVLPLFGCESAFELSKKKDFFDKLFYETIVKLFEHMLLVNDRQKNIGFPRSFSKQIDRNVVRLLQTRRPHADIYGTAFAKSDRTDAILVVDGKKLHVNKAVKSNAENILELADRFLLPSTKVYMEPFMIHFDFSSLDFFCSIEAMRLGEKYQIDSLYQKGFDHLLRDVFDEPLAKQSYQQCSSDTKRKIFNRYLDLHRDYSYY